jgi:hypothetical protein
LFYNTIMEYNPETKIEKEMFRLIGGAQKHGITLRVVGGLAVKIRCPRSLILNPDRVYNDMDMITSVEGGKKLGDFFADMGYGEDRTLNLLNGDRRQLYFNEDQDWQVDVFVGDFQMCHKIPLGVRLANDTISVPLAELFLMKAQIVELNQKDALDLLTLLWDHDLGRKDGDFINAGVITDLCVRDWGLFTTLNINLERLQKILQKGIKGLDDNQHEIIAARLERIKKMLEEAPKTQAWKLRSMVGKRMRWYEEVEEVRR